MLIRNFNSTWNKKQGFSTSITETSENVHLIVSFLWLEFVFIYSISFMYKYLLELIKRRLKLQEKNISCERNLNFDQWKAFFENYKPIKVWLLLVYKITEDNCRLQLFSEFIQTQNSYPTSLDKISILTWKLLVISSQNFSCELNFERTYSLFVFLWFTEQRRNQSLVKHPRWRLCEIS